MDADTYSGTTGPGASLRTFAGFTIMCIGMFMAILDVQIVATSLPTIQQSLRIAPEQMSWVQTAYLIAEVVAIPLSGFLTGLVGLRLLFCGAVLMFAIASLGCALSGGFAGLVAWRVVQGFSGGMLIPAVFAAVFLFFPVRLQGRATTIAGVLAVLAPTVGPIAGGWITQTYSWHWLFLVNVLPGLAVGFAGLAILNRVRLDGSHGSGSTCFRWRFSPPVSPRWKSHSRRRPAAAGYRLSSSCSCPGPRSQERP